MFSQFKSFALCAVSALLFAGAAQAAAVTFTVSAEGLLVSRAAETAFLASLGTHRSTETFEGFVAGSQGKPLESASVGSFSMDWAGSGGACVGKLGGCAAGAAILNSTNSPFGGRFNTTPGGTRWLDSFDARIFTFSPLDNVNSIGFFLTDANDAGGRYDLEVNSDLGTISFDDIFGGGLSNGRVFYLAFTSASAITGITIFSNSSADGFGIDNVTVGQVPEPGTVALLGLGLLAAGALRRRRAA